MILFNVAPLSTAPHTPCALRALMAPRERMRIRHENSKQQPPSRRARSRRVFLSPRGNRRLGNRTRQIATALVGARRAPRAETSRGSCHLGDRTESRSRDRTESRNECKQLDERGIPKVNRLLAATKP